MAKIVNPKWQATQRAALDSGQPIDEVVSYNPAAQWLIALLSNRDKPFAVYSLGAGVKRITTTTEVCPCCKKPL